MPGIEISGTEYSAAKFNAEPLNADRLMRGPYELDHTQFNDARAVVVTLTAQANAAAISLAVSALSAKIPYGTLLHFDSGEFARVTAEAAAGATTITVEALPNQIESGDIAYYSKYNRKFVKAGTAIGRTHAERIAGTAFGPARYDDDEIFLLAFDKPDIVENPLGEAIKPGTQIFENFLPEWATLNANLSVTVTVSGTLSAGNIVFVNNRTGDVSDQVAYNGNAAAIQAALEGLFGTGDVTVSGTMASFTAVFASDLAAIDVDLGVDGSGLTGLDGIDVAKSASGQALLTELRKRYNMTKGVN